MTIQIGHSATQIYTINMYKWWHYESNCKNMQREGHRIFGRYALIEWCQLLSTYKMTTQNSFQNDCVLCLLTIDIVIVKTFRDGNV